ncbi:MAG TPA: hypothetical protein VF472_21775 [Burkholderiaceae bacterium]
MPIYSKEAERLLEAMNEAKQNATAALKSATEAMKLGGPQAQIDEFIALSKKYSDEESRHFEEAQKYRLDQD